MAGEGVIDLRLGLDPATAPAGMSYGVVDLLAASAFVERFRSALVGAYPFLSPFVGPVAVSWQFWATGAGSVMDMACACMVGARGLLWSEDAQVRSVLACIVKQGPDVAPGISVRVAEVA
jgi:hypothetical protein